MRITACRTRCRRSASTRCASSSSRRLCTGRDVRTPITMLSPRERSRRSIIESYTRQPIRERALPGLEEIIARRDADLVKKVEDQMIQADHDRERELIARMVQNGYDPLEIASAALKLARAGEKELPLEQIQPVVFESRRRRSAEEENTRRPRKEGSSSASRSERYSQSEARSADKSEKPRRSSSEHAGAFEPRSNKAYAGSKAGGKHRKEGEPGYIRLCMNLGDMHGLRPKDVVGAIAGEVGIPGKAIGEISIYRDHTFVDVSEKHARQVLRESVGKYMLRGQPVTLKLA